MARQTDGIAVFGSSEPAPGDPLYEQAYRLGRLLAEAGHRVISGGYGGVMEAASRGAREAGGRTLGVPCGIFDRTPNRYLSEVVDAPDLYDRTRELIDSAGGFVILEGKAGTLAELSMLWALHRAGCLAGRPVVLLGDRWTELLDYLDRNGILEPSQVSISRVAATPDQAVELLNRQAEC